MDYTSDDGGRQRVAAEVLELGQALFEAIIEAATPPADSAGDTEREPFPLEDARAAADEFFAALRMLLERQTPHADDG